jgi:hypothetical protein
MDKVVTLRPVVLFAAAYAIIGILHESAHALTAYVLKVPFVFYHLYVRLNPAAPTLSQRAIIGVSGPLFCLVVGLVCWFAYHKTGKARAALWLLYLGWFGIATLLGNLMSTAFVGDFSALARLFDAPMPVRYVVTLFGALSLCAFAFLMGKELRGWAPAGVSGVKALIGMIVVPVIAGTVLALLIYLPMPFEFAVGRIGESAFWIFALVGILSQSSVRITQPSVPSPGISQNLRLSWDDVAILLVAIGIVRVIATGVIHVP